MDSATPRPQSDEKLVIELKSAIKNAERLLRETEQNISPVYAVSRSNLERTLHTAKIELAKFEDAKLTRLIDAAYAANRFLIDQADETVTLHALE